MISALFRMTLALALFALIVAVVLFVVATSLFGVASTNLTSEGRTATFKAALLDRVLTCSSEGPGDRSTFRLTPDLHRDGVLLWMKGHHYVRMTTVNQKDKTGNQC